MGAILSLSWINALWSKTSVPECNGQSQLFNISGEYNIGLGKKIKDKLSTVDVSAMQL